MVNTIKHRGPDNDGIFLKCPIGLGHSRLSVIDPSTQGNQPMVSHCGTNIISYNGEIYNFDSLKNDLISKGYQFTSLSDTETLLNAYIEWGPTSFSLLEGMFAFAIWDDQSQTLHLARDRFGIKPLYYHIFPSGIVFGSEIKSILASGKISRSMDWESLNQYLIYGTSLGTNTMFNGIRKLPPGYRLEVNLYGSRLIEYDSIYDVEETYDDTSLAIEKVKYLLDQSVSSHLVSDVPVGIFLSGGRDSSTITAFASRHYEGKISTYSVGFDFDKGVNELKKAKRVADYFNTDHNELHVEGRNIPEVIEKLVLSHDEPFGDAANIPLYLLSQQLNKSIKVILQGDGGDELFAGYRRYNILSKERFWHWSAKISLPFNYMLPKTKHYHRLMRFFEAIGHNDPSMRMALLLTEEPFSHPPSRLLSDSSREKISAYDPYAIYKTYYERFEDLDPVQRMLYTDMGVLLPNIFLEKVDKATMAHGIEIRVPMLDKNLTKYVMSLPSSIKVKKGQKKWILREAMRGIIPDDILDAPKRGFGVPYAHWLRTSMADYMKNILLDDNSFNIEMFNKKALENCINEHIQGKRNHGFLLYKLLMLTLWHKLYING